MSPGQRDLLIVITAAIVLVLGGIFSNWYGALDDTRPAPAPIGTAKPTRPPHPASIYYPPGVPQPAVPGDPCWNRKDC